jgi:hypothetical protein
VRNINADQGLVLRNLAVLNAQIFRLIVQVGFSYIFPSFNFISEKISDSYLGWVKKSPMVCNISLFVDRFKKLYKQLLDRDGHFGTDASLSSKYLEI